MFFQRVLKAICIALCVFAGSSQAAVLYSFSGVDEGGTASATMLLDIVGNTLTATINNTSPNPNPNPDDLGDPALTGFGFRFSNAGSLSMTSWCLSAGATNIGGTCAGSTNAWLFETGMIDGVDIDFGAETDKGIKGGLYALGADDLGGPPHYFGEAIFTVVFNTTPTLEALFGPGCSGNNADGCSPFVRFQNVGEEGEGSLKLAAKQPCVPGQTGPTCLIIEEPIPEPGVLTLLGLAIMGLAFSRRS